MKASLCPPPQSLRRAIRHVALRSAPPPFASTKRMAARSDGVPGAGKAAARFDFARLSISPASSTATQSKLRVSDPSEPLEREADQVAEAVTSGSAGPVSVRGAASRSVSQLACTECQEDEAGMPGGGKRVVEDDTLGGGKRTQETVARAGSGAERAAALGGLGDGQPLPAAERHFFERRFGFDFRNVRIHHDTRADDAAAALGARAFTRGSDIGFAAGEFSPGTSGGRRLLAHELTHVVQQSTGATEAIQRDLATPPPATPAPSLPDLTDDQIKAALTFNRNRFDARHTKQIQDLVGTEPSGTWKDEDVVAIAALQQEYGLKKDGMVGPATFRFLVGETAAEGLPKTDENCLVSFTVLLAPVAFKAGPAAGQRDVRGHFEVHALLPSYCNCADYEYRQFIKGSAKLRSGATTTDQASAFSNLPKGSLTTTFEEDGDTSDATAVHYGHRGEGAEGSFNQYSDDAGKADQANGCKYDNTDSPGLIYTTSTGDVLDMQISFRGEIQRKGKVVRHFEWDAIKGSFTTP
jgi:hypothetical protein